MSDDTEDDRPDERDGYDVAHWESMDEDRECFHCAGTGYTDCTHPMECTKPHLGGSYGSDGGEVCPCASCGGSGLAKDMTLW